jgi:hypothetical protein
MLSGRSVLSRCCVLYVRDMRYRCDMGRWCCFMLNLRLRGRIRRPSLSSGGGRCDVSRGLSVRLYRRLWRSLFRWPCWSFGCRGHCMCSGLSVRFYL